MGLAAMDDLDLGAPAGHLDALAEQLALAGPLVIRPRLLATRIGAEIEPLDEAARGPASWDVDDLAGLAAAVALFIFLVLPRLDRAIQKYGA